jgi:fucose 4-O-acetylase-like acetyltransferase
MENNPAVDVHLSTPIHETQLDMAQARNLWVDYAKAIGIILVVYGHVARGIFNAGIKLDQGVFELMDSVIYSFHMPLFFFLSGLFFLASMTKRDSISLLRSKVDTILYPYVIWSLLQGMIEVALTHYTNGHTTIGEVLSFAWSPRAQFWFLYTLFFVFALAILVYRRPDIKWCGGILIGSILLNFFTAHLPDIFLLRTLSHYFVYFAAGVLAAFMSGNLNKLEIKWLILSVALFVFSQWLFHIEMGLRYYSETPSKLLLLGMISICFIVILAQWLTRFKLHWLAYLGQQSMTIYLVHILVGSGCRIILLKIFGITSVEIHLVIGTLGGLLLPLLFYSGCMRYGFSALFSPNRTFAFGKR